MKRSTSKTVPFSSNSVSTTNKKKKNINEQSFLMSLKSNESPFNFESPEKFFSSLLYPACSINDFFEKYWEKEPLVIPASSKCDFDDSKIWSNQFKDYFNKLFNLDALKEIFKKSRVMHGIDVIMCKYVDKSRTNLDKNGQVKAEHIQKYFHGDKMTLQFHQPQRFHDELWKIQEMMECFFGSLIGSNIYMTPENSQGLAPHHDNVEVFVLQLEGKKHWKLYKPLTQLAKECSGDLSVEELNRTKLIKEVTLEVGDVLYFPRGTIHQARVEGPGHSTHVTISAYASNSWQDYFLSALPNLEMNNSKTSLALRRGLPLNYHLTDTRRMFKEKLHQALQALSSTISTFSESDVCDELACDFFANRLPPFGYNGDPVGNLPTLESAVRFVDSHHVILSKGKGLYEDDKLGDVEDDDFDSDEEFCDDNDAEEASVYVYYSHKNERSSHMLGTAKTKPQGLRFDVSCWEGLVKLHKSGNQFIEVKDLNFPDLLGLDLLVGLWGEGIIETKQ